MKRVLFSSLLGATLVGQAFAATTTLTVYSALEADQLQVYEKAFNAVYPDIKLQWVRDSTGIVTAKLLAEKNNPKADAVWGLAGSALGLLASQDMLQPYAPQGLDSINSKMRDIENPPAWVGMSGYASVLCVNTVELEKQKLPMPSSWEDLLKPDYAGKIVMPNPASSGTGFLDVSAWLQLFGEEKGWTYMDGLHKNIGSYTHSGSKPCNLAAAGEYPIGISFDYRGVRLKEQGAPLALVFPSEGLGWEIEAAAIIKGSKNMDAAQKLADFSASEAAAQMYKEQFAVLARPVAADGNPELPSDLNQRLIDNDFAWSATNRERIIKEWTKRYDGKTEAK